jgi:hypothetical protein
MARNFTDGTLVVGSTPIKAAHINELRTAIDEIEANIYGLAVGSYQKAIGIIMSMNNPNDNQESNQIVFTGSVSTTLSTIKVVCPTVMSTNLWLFRYRVSDGVWIKIADFNVTGDTSVSMTSVSFVNGDKMFFKINGNANNLPWITVEVI